jgi:fructose-bisphosphate aldolase class II
VPIATPEVYAEMLDRAKAGRFAYPAINVTSSQTLNAALRGFAEAQSDGIVQVSTGGAEYLSGSTSRTWCSGRRRSRSTRTTSPRPTTSTSRCTPTTAPRTSSTATCGPLIAISQERVDGGREPLFQSHMWDGSAVELEENLSIAQELLEQCAKARIVMELEIGVVGGEEDGVDNSGENEKLYTTPGDALRTAELIGTGEKGRYMLAATFGNVHGVYKPGNVKLRPSILNDIQQAVARRPAPRSRSTWSSTAAPDRCSRRSRRRWTTAS